VAGTIRAEWKEGKNAPLKDSTETHDEEKKEKKKKEAVSVKRGTRSEISETPLLKLEKTPRHHQLVFLYGGNCNNRWLGGKGATKPAGRPGKGGKL